MNPEEQKLDESIANILLKRWMQWVTAVHTDKQILKRTGQGHHRWGQTGIHHSGLGKVSALQKRRLGCALSRPLKKPGVEHTLTILVLGAQGANSWWRDPVSELKVDDTWGTPLAAVLSPLREHALQWIGPCCFCRHQRTSYPLD